MYWVSLQNRVHSHGRQLFVALNFTAMLFCTVYVKLNTVNVSHNPLQQTHHYRTIGPQNLTTVERPVILLWTTFFGGVKWFTESRDIFLHSSRDCILTNNKSAIDVADAVVFHLNDIAWYGSFINGFGVKFPTYRSPKQIWILYNLEPLPQIYFDDSTWNGLFNWTMSYNIDSDVPVPYGEFKSITDEERVTKMFSRRRFHYYREHRKSGGIALISNCIDDAMRYRIIHQLQKHISIKVFGKCGEPSPEKAALVKDLARYKFYLALENSDCEHYVTEKYWKSLERHQIPIVAWRNNMSRVVIPGSYINVFDFQNLDEAGKHIAEVNRNESLYNSYFNWTFSYGINYQNGWCKLCDALHRSNISYSYYHNIHGWLHDDTCKPLTLFGILHRIFDRFIYDMRIY